MNVIALQCIRCNTRHTVRAVVDGCSKCNEPRSNLRAIYADDPATRLAGVKPINSQGLWRYASMLPISTDNVITLQEGGTPLLQASRLGEWIGHERLYLKDETRNPTWSYKDRLSSVAVAVAKYLNAKVLATASSGNAGASLAAYAARAGMPCVVFTCAGSAGPMLAQMKKYGAKVISLARKQDRWPLLAECIRQFNWFATSPYTSPVVGSHPLGIEAYKTMAYEICEDLNWDCPNWVVMPTCYGDGLAGAWYGFQELRAAGLIERLPKMVAVEVFGSLGAALATDQDQVPDMQAEFAPLAVSVGATQSSYQALNAIRESGGQALSVGNEGLVAMQAKLAETEGVFAELSAVMPLIAIERLKRMGQIRPLDSVVGVVTASGLKDLDKSTVCTEDEEPVQGNFGEVVNFLVKCMNFNPVQGR